MTEEATETKPKRRPRLKPAEQAAKAAILANPEFVLEDGEIMRALLEPTRPTSRKIVDLRSALVERLERRLSRLVEAHRDVIDAAWDSISGMEQTHQAVLALMACRDVTDGAAAVAGSFAETLELDCARLCFEHAPHRDDDAEPATGVGGPRPLPPGFVAQRLQGRGRLIGPVLFGPVERADRAVFGPQIEGLASVAMIALDAGSRGAPGLLACGSADATRFEAGKSADLWEFVARATKVWLERLEPAPAR